MKQPKSILSVLATLWVAIIGACVFFAGYWVISDEIVMIGAAVLAAGLWLAAKELYRRDISRIPGVIGIIDSEDGPYIALGDKKPVRFVSPKGEILRIEKDKAPKQAPKEADKKERPPHVPPRYVWDASTKTWCSPEHLNGVLN